MSAERPQEFLDEEPSDEEPTDTSEAPQKDAVGLYLDEIAKTPLLTAEQEVELSKDIEAGLMAEHVLAGDVEVSTDASDAELEWLAERGRQALQEFAKANLRLVVSIAKKRAHTMPLLDLVQEGNVGAIHAIEKFDYTKGFKFSTYGTWWIRQAITRAIAQQSHATRIPINVSERINAMEATRRAMRHTLGREPKTDELAEALDVDVSEVAELTQYNRSHVSLDQPLREGSATTLGDLREQATMPDTEAAAMALLSNEAVAKVLDTLDERSADVVRRRYGFVTGKPEQFIDIAPRWGVTAQRVLQIERSAIKKLRRRIQRGDLPI